MKIIKSYLSRISAVLKLRQEAIREKRQFGNHMFFENAEGDNRYNFFLPFSNRQKGVSGMIRMRNESSKITHVLASVYDLFDEIVVVDNDSDDDCLDMVKQFRETRDPDKKIKIFSYPFRLVRFGREHNATPPNSLRSAVYFTNYCLSKCTYKYACRWDADMVAIPERKDRLRSFFKRIQTGKGIWSFSGQTVYRDLNGQFFLSLHEIHYEPRLSQVGYPCRFVKWLDSERVRSPYLGFQLNLTYPYNSFLCRKGVLRPVFYECKFMDEDEFCHWDETVQALGRRKMEKALSDVIINNRHLNESRLKPVDSVISHYS